MKKFYIYRKNQVEGTQPVDLAYGENESQALAFFADRNPELSGEFVASAKCRKIHWWLY